MRSTSHKKIVIFAFLLLAASFAFGQCTVPPCVNIDKQTFGSRPGYSAVDSGSANTYVLTTTASLGPTLRTLSRFYFFAAATNTGASTANVDSTGALAIKKWSSGSLVDLAANDITVGQLVELVYDGTRYQWNPPSAGGSITINGQSCALSGTCNVNVGASTHSLALNQGNGNALTGLLLGAHQVGIGTASSDPNAKTVPDCQDTTGNHLNFTQSSDTWNCGTSTPTGGGSCAGSSSSFGIVHTNNNSVVAHVAFASTVTCGNTLFALIHSLSSAVDPPVVADSACTGNWTLIDKNTANTRKLWFYYCVATSTVTAPLGAGDNVTSTTNCSHCGITVWEASGLAALDVHANTYFASSATPSITVTPSASNSVIFAGIAADDFNASVVSPLILGDVENGNDSEVWGYEQSLGGSVTASFTSAGGHTSDLPLVAASFKTANSYPGILYYQTDQIDGVAQPQEPNNDFVSGIGITITGADDSANKRTKATITRDALTGDVTTSGDAATLASVVTAGSCGDTTHTCALNYDAKGRITSASSSTISGAGTITGYVLLCSGTASSSATLDFSHTSNCSGVNPFTATYDDYQIRISHLVVGTNGSNVVMLVSTDGGTTYDTASNYAWTGFRQSVAGTANNVGSNSTTSFGLDVSGGASSSTNTGSFRATIDLADPFGGTGYPSLTEKAALWDGTANPGVMEDMIGYYKSVTAVNAFRIKASSGNLASGFVRVYGITH